MFDLIIGILGIFALLFICYKISEYETVYKKDDEKNV